MRRLLLLAGCLIAVSPFSVAQAPKVACKVGCIKMWAQSISACRGDRACREAARAALDACLYACTVPPDH